MRSAWCSARCGSSSTRRCSVLHQGLHHDATEVLVDYVSSIETATESAERIDEDEVCVMLGKLQQLVNEAMQCPS
eukprot:scaffold41978_cov84-Phaeocystis_antarctica.AAC.2